MSSATTIATPEYRFTETQDWFSHNIAHWTPLLPLVNSSAPRVLEIGSWEGRSAVFLLENLCKDTGEIVCIDHFDLFKTDAGKERFAKIQHNLSLTGKRSRVLPKFSVPALMQVLNDEMDAAQPGFDWLYIDGSHEADDTFLDGELAWRLAREGAILIFDDYRWDKEPEDSMHHPKRGIDAFLELHVGEYERFTAPEHYQVVIRKLTPMRIGFLSSLTTPGAERELDTTAFEYGVNLALAVDSAFAVGAAVTVHSAIEHTPGRISVYVVDCGLSSDDRERFEKIVHGQHRVTLNFVELPPDSLGRQMGPVWSKIDMLGVLPVERVLYLDADTLVRRDLRPLWRTDLQGKPLGAVVDVGYPKGWEEGYGQSYFNAGVLLFDLAQVRVSLAELKSIALSKEHAKYRDQDALNAHFAGDKWMSLDLQWNAQGLGTYAKHSTSERDALALDRMGDPSIVHFTGPVHPSDLEVRNPYVQPPTAKPWGYLGAPGHPYAAEWWVVFDKTPWRGQKEAMIRANEKAQQKIKERMGDEFAATVVRLTAFPV